MVTYYEWFFITICMIIVNESVLHFIMHSGELPIEKTPNLCGSSPALSVPSYDYDPNKLILGIHQSDSEGMFSENDTAFPSSSTQAPNNLVLVIMVTTGLTHFLLPSLKIANSSESSCKHLSLLFKASSYALAPAIGRYSLC